MIISGFRLALIVGFVALAPWGLELSVSNFEVQKAAEFAVAELSVLSDSGVYSTLKLSDIVTARSEEGLYHDNLVLTLKIASPHFASGAREEEFEVVVMTHKEDGIRSIAIDEFPNMLDSSIEDFYEKKVELKAKEREESFRRLEIEAVLSERLRVESPMDENSSRVKDMVEASTVKAHLDGLDTLEMNKKRLSESLKIQSQLPKKYLDEEVALQNMPLSRLYSISIGEIPATNYQLTRSIDILDFFLQDV